MSLDRGEAPISDDPKSPSGAPAPILDTASTSAGGVRKWLWTLLAVGLVVVASGVAILLSRGSRFEPRWELYNQGVDAFEQGSYGLAHEIFVRYIERYGEYPPARYMLGVSLYRLDRREEAIQAVLTAAREDPDLDEANQFLAERAYEAGRFREALQFARQALAREPEPAGAHLIAGMVLGQPEFRDVSEGIRHLTAAEEQGAGCLPSRLLLLELLRSLRQAFPDRVDSKLWSGLVDRAELGIEALRRADPGDPSRYLLLARLYLVTDRPAAARVALADARKHGIESPEYRYLLARADWLEDNRSSAVLQVRHFLKLDPPPVLLFELATFLGDRGETDLAAEVVNRGVELYADDPAFRLWQIRWLLGADRAEEAETLSEACREKFADESEFDLLLAMARQGTGRADDAEVMLRRMIEEGKNVSAARLRLADLLLGEGDTTRREEARTLLGAAADDAAADPTFLRFLEGKAALLDGDLRTARERFEAAITRDPTRPRFHALLAEVLLRLEEPDRAAEELSATIRLRGPHPELRLARARAYFASGPGSLGAAREDLRAVLEANPANQDALGLLAAATAVSGGESEPEDWDRLTAAAERDDASPRFLLAMGRCLMLRGDRAGAERLAGLARDRASDPRDRWDAIEFLARLTAAGDPEPSASRVLEILRSAARQETSLRGKLRYGWFLLEGGDAAGARAEADAALVAEPGDTEALRLKFETCFATPDAVAALAEAREVAEAVAGAAVPGADVEYVAGKLALVEGDREAARDHLERAIALSPEDYYAACFLGRTLFELGDLAKATARLHRALRLRPDFRTARQFLAEVKLGAGRKMLDAGRAGAAAQEFLMADDLAPGDGRGALAFARTVLDRDLRDNRLLRKQARQRCARLIGSLRAKESPLDEDETEVLSRSLLAETELALLDSDFRGAATGMAAYLEIHPDDEGARIYRTISLLFSGDLETAVAELRTLAASDPDAWAPTALLGEALLRAGRPGEAEAVYADWLARFPDDPDAALCLVEALRRQDRSGAAIEVLTDVLEARPDAVDCAIRLTELARDGEVREKARTVLAAALARTKHPGDLRFLLQKLAPESEGSGALERALSEGFARLSLEVQCYGALIKELTDSGQGEKALRYARTFREKVAPRLEESRDRIPPGRLAETWEMVGVAHYGEDDLETAELCFRRALSLAPDYALAANNLAYLLLSRPVPEGSVRRGEDLDEAEALARKAVETEPENPDFQDTRGAIALARGEYELAAECFGAVADRWAGEPDAAVRAEKLGSALLRVAEARARAGDPDGARAALARATAADPSLADAPETRRIEALLPE